MFRATGEGKVEIFLDVPIAGIIGVLLYNFDFDDYDHLKTLKSRFTEFLKGRVVPLALSDRGQIWMQGSASKIGTDEWNLRLSQNRVVQTAAFLTSQGIDPGQMQLDAIGEEQAASHASDDERDRGVRLWVYPKNKIIPHPPRPTRRVPKPLVSRNFFLERCPVRGTRSLRRNRCLSGSSANGRVLLRPALLMDR